MNIVKLSDVAEIIRGTGSFPASASGMTVKFVGTSNLENLITINTDNAKIQKISKKSFQANKLRKIRKNDILISLVGNTLGKTSIVTKNLDCYASSNLVVVRPNRIRPEYLLSVLNSKKTQRTLSKLSTGTAQKRLHYYPFREHVEIPLPSDSEQLKVVKKFNVLANKITSLNLELEKAKKELDNFEIK
jgi:restriction endonuclease S subunit